MTNAPAASVPVRVFPRGMTGQGSEPRVPQPVKRPIWCNSLCVSRRGVWRHMEGGSNDDGEAGMLSSRAP
ncbi:hypothetical protein M8818_001703 [Zalaria obscura]|uniref:Uncharacterized protein n=1 Tax=Zalaria obscura TaxID=2024903 RepID=A0ACC3SNM7_9PEZI